MPTIAREDWPAELTAFTRRNVNYPIRLEVDAADLGAQTEADRTVLKGVAYDPRSGDVEVMLEPEGGSHLTHAIHDPREIDLLGPSGPRREVLRIAHAGGQTLLHVLVAGA
ncbi:MAG TPA: DUF5335 family protein [Longimicrobiales bacterium]|nr:DUF5335 family protein [Longimicrobiales bacterium]